jgi:hypothetical protein
MVEPVGRVTTLASNLLSGINEVSPPPQRSDSIEEGRAASKSPHKKFGYFAFLFLCPSKQFLPMNSFKIQLLKYFPQIQKEQRHKQLGYNDKLVTAQI